MRLFSFLMAAMMLAITYAAGTTIETDEDVLVLTDENFKVAIEENEFLLVEFYAPWCGHCRSLAPEYAKAAGELAKLDPPLRIAKLDATEHREAPKPYGVKGFPTLKFFRNGEASDYTGGRKADDIVKFIQKKSGPALATLNMVAEAEDFLSKNEKAGIGFFSSLESSDAKFFQDYAGKNDMFTLAYTSNKDVISKYSGKLGTMSFFTPEGSYVNPITDASVMTEVSNWIHGHSIPLLLKYDQSKAMELFGGTIRVHQLAFLDEEKKDDFEKYSASFKEVASNFRTQALSIYVPKEEGRILEAFGLTAESIPTLVIADMRGGAMKKFVYEGDLAKSSAIGSWVKEFFAGKLAPKLKSEEPTQEDFAKPVKVLKGKSFKEKVIDSDKDVLVEFYAPWCGHCRSLEPKYDELAKKLEGVNDIVIAKMDATANELDIPGVDIKGFPTIMLFPSGKKQAPISFDKPREVNEFLKFLKENGTKPFDVPVEESDADEEEEEDEKDEL